MSEATLERRPRGRERWLSDAIIAGFIAIGADLAYEEPLQAAAVAHSEDFGAAGIVVGAIVGALVGVGLAIVLPPVLPNVDFGGWEAALAVGGILAGGAVGGIVGSFAGLPQTPPDPAELAAGPDPFQHK